MASMIVLVGAPRPNFSALRHLHDPGREPGLKLHHIGDLLDRGIGRRYQCLQLVQDLWSRRQVLELADERLRRGTGKRQR